MAVCVPVMWSFTGAGEKVSAKVRGRVDCGSED